MALYLLVAAGAVLGVDQLSKKLVLGRFGAALWEPMRSGPRVRLISNPTPGLGLIVSRRGLKILWISTAVGAVLVGHFAPANHAFAVQLGLGAALGGATSNLLDLVRRGAVIDFIDLRVWPVFNVADVAILLGVTTVLFSMR